MGSNTLTTTTDHEVTNSDMWHQEKLALVGDIMPRNSSGVVENEAANLGSPTERWSVLACDNLVFDDIGPLNYEISSSCGSFSTSSKNLIDITNLSVTITTTGRPVMVVLVPDGSTDTSYVASHVTTQTANNIGCIAISRNGDIVFNNYLKYVSKLSIFTKVAYDIRMPPGSISVLDFVEAGTHNYKARARTLYDYGQTQALYCKLLAYEL